VVIMARPILAIALARRSRAKLWVLHAAKPRRPIGLDVDAGSGGGASERLDLRAGATA